MTQLEIDNTLKDFFFKKEELDKRSVFEEFVQTLSNIIVDDFSQNYLLPNPEFSTYLSNTDTNRLLKNTKELDVDFMRSEIKEAKNKIEELQKEFDNEYDYQQS